MTTSQGTIAMEDTQQLAKELEAWAVEFDNDCGQVSYRGQQMRRAARALGLFGELPTGVTVEVRYKRGYQCGCGYMAWEYSESPLFDKAGGICTKCGQTKPTLSDSVVQEPEEERASRGTDWDAFEDEHMVDPETCVHSWQWFNVSLGQGGPVERVVSCEHCGSDSTEMPSIDGHTEKPHSSDAL